MITHNVEAGKKYITATTATWTDKNGGTIKLYAGEVTDIDKEELEIKSNTEYQFSYKTGEYDIHKVYTSDLYDKID